MRPGCCTSPRRGSVGSSGTLKSSRASRSSSVATPVSSRRRRRTPCEQKPTRCIAAFSMCRTWRPTCALATMPRCGCYRAPILRCIIPGATAKLLVRFAHSKVFFASLPTREIRSPATQPPSSQSLQPDGRGTAALLPPLSARQSARRSRQVWLSGFGRWDARLWRDCGRPSVVPEFRSASGLWQAMSGLGSRMRFFSAAVRRFIPGLASGGLSEQCSHDGERGLVLSA